MLHITASDIVAITSWFSRVVACIMAEHRNLRHSPTGDHGPAVTAPGMVAVADIMAEIVSCTVQYLGTHSVAKSQSSWGSSTCCFYI